MLAELLLAALVVGFALAALVSRSASRRTILAALGAWVLLCGGLAWLGSRYWDPSLLAGERAVENRPIELHEDGYASSDTCRSCHPHEYATWHASYHRKMTQVPSPETVVAPFDGVRLEAYGHEYLLEERDGRFWVDQPGIWEPGKPERVEKPVVLTTGSHHYQLFWLPTGRSRALELFQFAWRIDQQRWMNIDHIFLFPPDVRQVTEMKGHWNVTCSPCHATLSKPRVVGSQVDTRVAEFGIACEACHGPGLEHIEANRDPLRRLRQRASEEPDPTIVHPEHLSPEISSHVCGQCHGIFEHDDPQKVNFEGVAYRPGDDLRDSRQVLLSGDPSRYWPDGMNRTTGRDFIGLANSPCYQHGDESRGIITCMSCHSMHQQIDDTRPAEEWANDQLKPDMQGNQACLQCHPQLTEEPALVAHTHHPEGSSGSSCYNCHMPHTIYGLLKASRSHTVSNPTVQESLEAGRPNACNLCHLDRTLEWTARHLNQRYGTPIPELGEEQREVSAAVTWLLRGDAAQRALIAWSMGWEPAQEASGSDWLAPFLAQLLADPYAPNRFIAHRSLRSIPGFEDFDYAEDLPLGEREAAMRRARETWRGMPTGLGSAREAILIDENGVLEDAVLTRLLRQRDDRRVGLIE